MSFEIPILWPRVVIVGPRPRVLLTPPVYAGVVAKVQIMDLLNTRHDEPLGISGVPRGRGFNLSS
jgi:hypothetical protein